MYPSSLPRNIYNRSLGEEAGCWRQGLGQRQQVNDGLLIRRFDTHDVRVPGRKLHARVPILTRTRTRTMERERTRGGGYACVHKPNVAAMVPLCILISTVFPHSACTGVH